MVNPGEYIRKYIPANYSRLSKEEKSKIKISDYEELNIYRLPAYKDLDHKYIMSLYVKKNISKKEIRLALFYALRNHDYMDKFYNVLRRYGLFKKYLDFSHYYYEEKISDWKRKNNIDKKVN